MKTNDELFRQTYLSVVQILVKLADPTFLWGELGRGSGKTTHILGPRIDRVQNAMPGSLLVLGAATYKSIFDNIIPGVMEYFMENYERGFYFEVGKEPPRHFAPCGTFIDSWRHTISFVSGTVIQFVSCDRPESMLGKNAAHLFVDEMIRIPEQKFTERIIPALRSDRSKYGNSEYFMGITGFSSSPNFETDEDWFTKYESNMNRDLMMAIQEIAYEIDQRIMQLEVASSCYDELKIARLTNFIERWGKRLTEARRGQTLYLRASSFSNIKILGVEYIKNQIKSIKDEEKLLTSIFSVRREKVKERFFGRFTKNHIFYDSYNYDIIDTVSAGGEIETTSRTLKYCDPVMPLFAGFDPGPFMSLVFAQKKRSRGLRELRVLKNMYVIHPNQHAEMARKIAAFFKFHRRKEIYLHFDRAANQIDPIYRKYYRTDTPETHETDAKLLRDELAKLGWRAHLLSLGQGTILYSTHYALLNRLFGKREINQDTIFVDGNECEELVSSINHSPLKRHEGRIILDKSSERLPYDQQAMYSTQISSAFMYLLYGEFKNELPRDF